jgi:hypothetical protein
MICRIEIPTVVRPNELEILPQARVHVTFDNDVHFIHQEQARAAAEWLEAADLAFDSEPAGQLAAALRTAVTRLHESPPRLVPERFLGMVEATRSDGRGVFLEVALETAVMEASNPRIMLSTSVSVDRLGNSWWLFEREATRVSELLTTRKAGMLTEVGPNQRPFLHVTPEGEGAELRFEDELIDEQDGEDGLYRLAAPAAVRLADLLMQAVALSEEQPAYVFVPPEPRDVLIAELRW